MYSYCTDDIRLFGTVKIYSSDSTYKSRYLLIYIIVILRHTNTKQESIDLFHTIEYIAGRHSRMKILSYSQYDFLRVYIVCAKNYRSNEVRSKYRDV